MKMKMKTGKRSVAFAVAFCSLQRKLRWVIATGKSVDRAVSDSSLARQAGRVGYGRLGSACRQSEEGATVAASTQDEAMAIANGANSCQNSLSLSFSFTLCVTNLFWR